MMFNDFVSVKKSLRLVLKLWIVEHYGNKNSSSFLKELELVDTVEII